MSSKILFVVVFLFSLSSFGNLMVGKNQSVLSQPDAQKSLGEISQLDPRRIKACEYAQFTSETEDNIGLNCGQFIVIDSVRIVDPLLREVFPSQIINRLNQRGFKGQCSVTQITKSGNFEGLYKTCIFQRP